MQRPEPERGERCAPLCAACTGHRKGVSSVCTVVSMVALHPCGNMQHHFNINIERTFDFTETSCLQSTVYPDRIRTLRQRLASPLGPKAKGRSRKKAGTSAKQKHRARRARAGSATQMTTNRPRRGAGESHNSQAPVASLYAARQLLTEQ